MIEIRINPNKILRVLAAVIGLLTFANLVAIVAARYQFNDVYGIIRLFDVEMEANLPTFYSSMALLFSACLLAIIALRANKAKPEDYRYWMGLTVLFAGMAVDEICTIHEMTVIPLREWLGVSGYLYFSWIIPAMLLLGVFCLMYARFFMRLPGSTKRMMIFFSVCVLGAIACEMIEGEFHSRMMPLATKYRLIVAIEEFLEMAAVFFWIRGLLFYLVPKPNFLFVTINTATTASRPMPALNLRDANEF